MTLPAADMFHIHSKYSFLTEAWHSFSYTYEPNVYVSELGIMHLRIKRARQEKVHLQYAGAMVTVPILAQRNKHSL
jgi:hypothetical protein